MGGKSKAPAPDPSIGLAQREMSAIAREQLDFAREAYYAEQPRLERYADLTDMFVQAQVQAMRTQTDLAANYQQRMQGTFYPIEDTLAFDALGYFDASPEVRQRLEQAFITQNQGLVQDRFAKELETFNQAEMQRQQSFEKQLAGLAADPGLAGTVTVQERQGILGRLKGNDGTTVTYTPDMGAALNQGLDSRIVAARQQIQALETQMAGLKPDSAAYKALLPRLNEAKEQAAKLTAFRSEFSDFLTVGEDGRTLAEANAEQRRMGLETAREREIANVGSTLDTVRAYAESYESGQQQAAGRARQDVASSFDRQQQQLQRQLQSFGVDPTSGRFAQTMNQNNIMQAAIEAQAMNQAREGARQLGWARRMDAASLGRGLPGSQATSVGLAQQQGQGALGAQAGLTGLNQQVNSAFMGGLGAASGTWGSVGNLGVQNSQLQMNAWNAQQQGRGALIGALAGAAGTALGGPAGGAGAQLMTKILS